MTAQNNKTKAQLVFVAQIATEIVYGLMRKFKQSLKLALYRYRGHALLMMKKGISIFILVCFFVTGQIGTYSLYAQEVYLPTPGAMVHLSPEFNPPILKGIKVHPDNPFRFDFILDKGDSHEGSGQLKDDSSRFIKYFLTSLTVPEKDLWVNLSPYEKDRIVPESFGVTEMGRNLLAEDYMLKQITASLIYPEDDIGKKFWKRVYAQASKKYGTTNIPVNTFNKVWIVPQKAVVYENVKAGTAYVVESKLNVMLEQDYLSLSKHEGIQSDQAQTKETNELGGQIVREIVIPELVKEVNEGKNFAQLRQVYNSLILAVWYKKKMEDSVLAQVYEDKNKIAGMNIKDPQTKQKIYEQYLHAFKKGVYNYIKEEVDPATQESIPRKYFSGGFTATNLSTSPAMAVTHSAPNLSTVGSNFAMFTVDVRPYDQAMNTAEDDQIKDKKTSEFDDEIDRIAQESGIFLGSNTKVTLFIGASVKGYYCNLFENIVRRQYGFDMVYLPYPITISNPMTREESDKINLIKEQIRTNLRIAGAVITKPGKVVFHETDDNDIGAVNYIVKDYDSQTIARYAVDGEAWLKGLNHDFKKTYGKDYELAGKKVVIIGSGGAAREIAETLNNKAVDSVIFIDKNKDMLTGMQEMLKKLKADYFKDDPEDFIENTPENQNKINAAIRNAKLIINSATDKDHPQVSPLSSHEGFHEGQVVVDLMSRAKTGILLAAEEKGAVVYSGRSMFIYGMVIFMRGWMEKHKSTKPIPIPTEEQLVQSISLWLVNYAMLGNKIKGVLPGSITIRDGQTEHQVDIQIPRWMDLNKKIKQATFVFDIDGTLTPTGKENISGNNLEQIVRAVQLKHARSDLKIRIILISGSAYMRFVPSRFAKKVSELNWDKINDPEDVKKEIEGYLRERGQSAQEVRAFQTRGSIQQRIINPITKRFKEKGAALTPDDIQVFTATGGEKAEFDRIKQKFIYEKNEVGEFSDPEQLEVSRSLASNALRGLGKTLDKDFSGTIERLKNAKAFLGSSGVQELFEKATVGMDIEMLPFEHEMHIVFHDSKFQIDGDIAVSQAMEDFKRTAAFDHREGRYFPKSGKNFIIISLVDKSDQIKRLVPDKDEIIVGGGDSITDSFLWDKRFSDQILPLFFGKREDVAQHPDTILALHDNGDDKVYAQGSGKIMASVLDAMEQRKTWADVAFLNNRFSPRQVEALMETDHAMSSGKTHFFFTNHKTFAENIDQVKMRVNDADIIIYETVESNDHVYDEVSSGRLTPQDGMAEFERMEQRGVHRLRFPDGEAAFLKIIYKSGKKIYGEPVDMQEMGQLTYMSKNARWEFFGSFVNADIEQSLYWYRQAIMSDAERYFLREEATKMKVQEVREKDKRSNILVIKGAMHTPFYEAYKRDFPSENVTAEFLGFDGSASLNNELEREFCLQRFGLSEEREFSDGELLQAAIFEIMSVTATKINRDGLKKIVRRITRMADFENLSIYAKNHPPGRSIDEEEAYRLLSKHICDWLIDNKFATSEELARALHSKDEAMGAERNTGGIDFTAAQTPLEIKNEGEKIKFNLEPGLLVLLHNAPGFVPVIINVQPMTDLPAFLGLSGANKEMELSEI